jgi:hypothetical protein
MSIVPVACRTNSSEEFFIDTLPGDKVMADVEVLVLVWHHPSVKPPLGTNARKVAPAMFEQHRKPGGNGFPFWKDGLES